MRKRIFSLILIVSVAGTIFTGCSSNQTSNNTSQSVSESAQSGSNSSKSAEGADASSKSEQSKEAPDMMGEIKKIIINEITISLVEMPTNIQRNAEGDRAAGDRKDGNDKSSLEKKREDVLKLTGESATFIIPVGTPIISTKRGANGMESNELQLSDIYEGVVLQVWLKEGGSGEDKIAENVAVFSH